jgi:hypothetical protein
MKQSTMSSSTMSTQPVSGSAGEAITSRAIGFDEDGTFERLSRPTSISFEQEWNGLVKAAADLTKLELATHDDFEAALHRFLPVISAMYSNEEDFRFLLFDALRKSLGGFCENIGETNDNLVVSGTSTTTSVGPLNTNQSTASDEEAQIKVPIPIKLIGCDVGFAAEVSRSESLKFPSRYGVSTGGAFDSACLVYGDDANDATATVGLKLGNASCKDYDRGYPLWTSDHAPLARAVCHALTTFHSLARRGCVVREEAPGVALSVSLLSGRKKDETGWDDRLCCLEASLEIPEYLGGQFQCRIDRCVRFPPENSAKEEEAAFTQALAVFVKTLRIGLTNAKILIANKDNGTMAVSLCCLKPVKDLQLIASPIPLAKRSTHGITITQGELYRFQRDPGSVEGWIRAIEKKLVVFFGNPPTDWKTLLVKLSCKTVHNSLVFPLDSWRALERIQSKGTEDLKAELHKTVLACAFPSRECIVTVMKTLSAASLPSVFGTTLLLWEAFSKLVKRVLLPMASIGVVHTDIRLDPHKQCVCNILADTEAGQPSELRVIDFESLVILDEMRGHLMQDYAISLGHVRYSSSPVEFVFWQVLWMAYVWCPIATPDKLVTAELLVEGFRYRYRESQVKDFTQWIEGKSKKGLDWIIATCRGEKDVHVVEDALAFFRDAFAA